MNSRRRILESSPKVSQEAYRGEACKGTAAHVTADDRCAA
jgi:hypothetical protein